MRISISLSRESKQHTTVSNSVGYRLKFGGARESAREKARLRNRFPVAPLPNNELVVMQMPLLSKCSFPQLHSIHHDRYRHLSPASRYGHSQGGLSVRRKVEHLLSRACLRRCAHCVPRAPSPKEEGIMSSKLSLGDRYYVQRGREREEREQPPSTRMHVREVQVSLSFVVRHLYNSREEER